MRARWWRVSRVRKSSEPCIRSAPFPTSTPLRGPVARQNDVVADFMRQGLPDDRPCNRIPGPEIRDPHTGRCDRVPGEQAGETLARPVRPIGEKAHRRVEHGHEKIDIDRVAERMVAQLPAVLPAVLPVQTAGIVGRRHLRRIEAGQAVLAMQIEADHADIVRRVLQPGPVDRRVLQHELRSADQDCAEADGNPVRRLPVADIAAIFLKGFRVQGGFIDDDRQEELGRNAISAGGGADQGAVFSPGLRHTFDAVAFPGLDAHRAAVGQDSAGRQAPGDTVPERLPVGKMAHFHAPAVPVAGGGQTRRACVATMVDRCGEGRRCIQRDEHNRARQGRQISNQGTTTVISPQMPARLVPPGRTGGS